PLSDLFAGLAIPIALGTPTTGTLAAKAVVLYQIKPTTDGRLVAQLHAPGGATRLTLKDAQGNRVLTSDGQSTRNPDGLIDIHVPAGTDYLELENLGTAVAFTLTTSLTQASTPFQPIAVGQDTIAVVAGDFNGDGRTDLAVANNGDNTVSVLLGNG